VQVGYWLEEQLAQYKTQGYTEHGMCMMLANKLYGELQAAGSTTRTWQKLALVG
jgi:hypothetical protein